MPRDHFPAIDGLRAIAAYTVVIGHFSNLTNIFGGILGFGSGQLGVMLFFVISGFLMGSLYLRSELTASAAFTFLQRRVARVIPLYLAIVAISYLWPLNEWAPFYAITDRNLPYHLLFWRGISVLWTIPVEVQFYLLFPFIWLGYRLVGTAVLFFLAIIAIFALASSWTYPFIINYISYFFIGVAASLVPLSHANGKAIDIAFVACLLAYVLSFPRINGVEPSELWISPIYFLLIPATLLASSTSKLGNRILGSPGLKILGDSSYSAYLLHLPVYHTLVFSDVLRSNVYLFLAVFLVATIAVSWLSFRFIETPARRWVNGLRLGGGRQRVENSTQ